MRFLSPLEQCPQNSVDVVGCVPMFDSHPKVNRVVGYLRPALNGKKNTSYKLIETQVVAF